MEKKASTAQQPLGESERLSATTSSRSREFDLLLSIKDEISTVHKRIDEASFTLKRVDAETAEHGAKLAALSEKLLEPDTGLFARVRDVENHIRTEEKEKPETKEAVKKVDRLVDWREMWSKGTWIIFVAIIGGVLKYIFDLLVTLKK